LKRTKWVFWQNFGISNQRI